MSLIGALNIGSSGLATAQAALQTTGNNIANAGNADYTREVAGVGTLPETQLRPGVFMGNGVDLTGITRQIDNALQGRLRASISDNQGASTTETWLNQIESTFNALGDQSLSAQMGTFFSSWSNLANKPQDSGLRQIVLQNGDSLAKSFNGLESQLAALRTSAGGQLGGLAQSADALAQQVAGLNAQVVTAEAGGSGQANTVRDQRDAALKQLSQLMDIKTVEQPNGVIDVYAGSEPLVINSQSRGIALQQSEDAQGHLTYTVNFKSNGGTINVGSGQIGALLGAQKNINGAIDGVNSLAKNLIFELNKIHASGQGLDGFTTATAANAVNDTTAALNGAATGLAFKPVNGSFVVHVTQKDTGQSTSTLVQVDLSAGSASPTSLDSLKNALNAIPGVTASINAGKLSIQSNNSGAQISFSQDSSGVLAALGINSFFTGKDASTIAVNQTLMDQPNLLAAAQNGEPADNQTATAIAALASQSIKALNGQSLDQSYQSLVNTIGTETANAKTAADAAKAVNDTLQSQQQALSGVSVDEEAVNMIQQQRAFQASARYISAVDDMLKTVLQLV